MTDGTYLGPATPAAIPDDYVPTLREGLSLWDGIADWVRGIPDLRHIYLVGAGGSFAGLTAMKYVLDSRAVTASDHVNPAEFVSRAPRGVDGTSLVLVFSGKGETPETVRAAQWAVARGANVAAVTMGGDSPLADAVPTAFVGTSGWANQLLLQLVALAVLQREGVDVAGELAALEALPEALEAAVHAFEPRAARIAADMKDVPVTYLVASGPLVGPGETFTSCFLQEMQWMHAATINANTFFQGPFEVFDSETRSFLFLGEDATRPMGERALDFLSRYSGETVVLDSRDLDLPGIDGDQRGFVAPLVFYALMFRLAAHYAAVRGYALEGRRYMWQFAY
jgi:fructoselysine 6-phosphate deglycase